MEKIVIVCGPEGPDDTLLSWIEVAFPECTIEVRSPSEDEPQWRTRCDMNRR